MHGALQIVCNREFVARQLHRCVRLPKSQFGPGHLSEALCKQLSSPASYSATQSDLALSEGNQRVADAGAGFTRCWPCAASGMYRSVALLPGSSGKGRNPSPPGAIWGKTCFVLSSHAKRPRGELDASRFTPWSSPVRLCGSSATLKANADGRGTGTRGPITTKPKVTPYASEPFAESPPALLVRAGTASPTAFDTLEARGRRHRPPRAAARPWR